MVGLGPLPSSDRLRAPSEAARARPARGLDCWGGLDGPVAPGRPSQATGSPPIPHRPTCKSIVCLSLQQQPQNLLCLDSHLTLSLGIRLPPWCSSSGYLAPHRGPYACLPSEWVRQTPRRFPHTYYGRHCDGGISPGSGGVDHTASSHPLGQHRCAVCKHI